MSVLFDEDCHLRPLRPGAGRRSAWACTSSPGTLNQAALARDRARAAAAALAGRRRARSSCWMLAPVVDDQLLRAEVGYLATATLARSSGACTARPRPRPPTRRRAPRARPAATPGGRAAIAASTPASAASTAG